MTGFFSTGTESTGSFTEAPVGETLVDFLPAVVEILAMAFSAAAGGHAGLYTDVQALVFPSTGQFSTGDLFDTFETARTQPEMIMSAVLDITTGATTGFPIPVLAIEPDGHGPLVRPHGVRGQIIMS